MFAPVLDPYFDLAQRLIEASAGLPEPLPVLVFLFAMLWPRLALMLAGSGLLKLMDHYETRTLRRTAERRLRELRGE